MTKKPPLLSFLCLFLFFLYISNNQAISKCTENKCKINITTTINPISDIAMSVSGNLNEINSIIKGPLSPHNFILKPSDIININKSDVIIWVGPNLEHFLQKPICNILKNKILCLLTKNKIKLLKFKGCNDLQVFNYPNKNLNENIKIDPHIWLSPNNAIIICELIVNALMHLDPDNSKIYYNNYKKFKNKIIELDNSIIKSLRANKPKNYIVFHDAYQYFENCYKIKKSKVITLNPSIPLSINRINYIKKIIYNDNIQCIFTEPQFKQPILNEIAIEKNIIIKMLDPLGSHNYKTGLDGYIELINNLKNSLIVK